MNNLVLYPTNLSRSTETYSTVCEFRTGTMNDSSRYETVENITTDFDKAIDLTKELFESFDLDIKKLNEILIESRKKRHHV